MPSDTAGANSVYAKACTPVQHMVQSTMPRASRAKVPKGAPRVSETPWGAELAEHEAERDRLAGLNRAMP